MVKKLKNYLLIALSLIFIINNSKSKDIEIRYCSIKTPSVAADCYSYDTEKESCCYYKYDTLEGCVYLGTRYIGKRQYGALHVTCQGGFLNKINIFYCILLILLLIF